MKVSNYTSTIGASSSACKNRVYLAVTTDKTLYLIKQTGQRSWDAMNLDFFVGEQQHIHGNRITILSEVAKKVNLHQIYVYQDKVALRKAIMEFQAYGSIGHQDFIIEKA